MENKEIWNDIYKCGHEQKAPWDTVVSFVYRNKPENVENNQINILEVGCGTASNLRFFAQQGFQVSGVDFSADAINCAREFFEENNLSANLKVGSFDDLDFSNDVFDVVVDRAAMTCASIPVQQKAIEEIHRVLKPSGRFIYTPYSDTHSSALTSIKGEDGLSSNIKNGTLKGVGSICFVSREDIESFFATEKWKILSLEYETTKNMFLPQEDEMHSSWRVIVEKV